MKKNLMFAMFGAIALTGAVGLSSCTDEEVAEVSPGYNPETGEVNVDFVFNVSTANEPFSTRMTSADTQASLSETFRGIDNAYLTSFKLSPDGVFVSDASLTGKLNELGPVIGAGKLNPNQEASGDVTKSHRVLQLSLESGTNALLFYGKAIKDGTDLEEGKITMSIAATPSNTSLSMCKIVPGTATDKTTPQAKLQQYQNLMAAVLTDIIDNSGISAKEISFGTETKTLSLNWKDYATVSGTAGSYVLSQPTTDPADNEESLSLLGQRLAYTFVTLNTIHAGELRAGCGQAVADMVTDVMANVNQIISATPLNIREVAAIEVAKDIKARVDKFFNFSNENGYTWKSAGTVAITANFVLDNNKDLIDGDDNVSSNHKNLNLFPADFNLPLGSVILKLDIEAKTAPATDYTYTYNYQSAVDTYAMGSGTSQFDPKNYVYPAELCYFGNSAIRVSNETKVAGDYPDGVANWNSSSSWSTSWTNNGHVTSSTRAVAMRDNINYGTALLESKVRYGAKVLQDNNHKLQDEWSNHTIDEANNTIDVTERDDHFVLTGILVGGQNPEVGWNYLAKVTDAGFGSMVYDKTNMNIPKATAAGGGNSTAALYTLLWDNWDNSLKESKQRDVYIAMEFVNKSKNFYGENNLIRNGATFYLIGKLDPDKMPTGYKIPGTETECTQEQYTSNKSYGITWPENYALPPYESGSTIKKRRVFIQDFMTKASFVIGETSLQHALVAVPDLRSGQISLGLSVDLEWQTGIDFGEVILGQ